MSKSTFKILFYLRKNYKISISKHRKHNDFNRIKDHIQSFNSL